MCRTDRREWELFLAVAIFLLPTVVLAGGESDLGEVSPGTLDNPIYEFMFGEVVASAIGIPPSLPEKEAPESGVLTEGETGRTDSGEVYRMAVFSAHLQFVADLPLEYGYYIWRYAGEQGIDPYDFAAYVVSENSWSHADFSITGTLGRADNIEFDYEPDSYGKGGELGISQIIPYWVGKAKRKCKSEGWAEGNCDELIEGSDEFLAARKEYKKAVDEFGKKSDEAEAKLKVLKQNLTGGMFVPRINFRVAAYVVRKAQEKHAAELTPKQIKACKRARRKARKQKLPDPMCATQLYHEWWAHLKLAPEDRNLKCGRAGYKKRKFRKVRYSLVAFTRPTNVWKENRKEWQTYCEGRE